MARKSTSGVKRKATEEAINPKEAKMQSMDEKLDLILRNQAESKKEIDTKLGELTKQQDSICRVQDGVLLEQQSMKKKMEGMQAEIAKMKANDSAPGPSFKGRRPRLSRESRAGHEKLLGHGRSSSLG